MRAPISSIPAMPIALGLIAGIVVYGRFDFGQTVAIAIVVALFAVFALTIVLRKAYFGYCCASVAVGLLAAMASAPGEFSEQMLNEKHSYIGVVAKNKDYDGAQRCVVDIISPASADGRAVRCMTLTPSSERMAQYGDTVEFVAQLMRIKDEVDVPYEVDYQSFCRADNVTYFANVGVNGLHVLSKGRGILVELRRLRECLIDMIIMSDLQPSSQTLLAACVAGEDTYLNPQIKADFRAAGIAHLLALSGFHVGIVVIILNILLFPMRAWTRVGRLRYVIMVICVWLYAAMLGFMPSVTRAAVMLSVFILAKLLERKSSPYNSLSVAAIAILICSPNSLYSPGFQLSFMAVLAILMFAYAINPIDGYYHELYTCVALFTVPLAAIFGTGVISAYYFHSFPLLFLPVNVVMALLFPVFMIGGLLAVVVSFHPLSVMIDFVYDVIQWLSESVAQLPYAQYDKVFMTQGQFISLMLAVGALAVLVNSRRRAVLLCSVVVMAASMVVYALSAPVVPNDEFFITHPAGRTDLLMHHGDSCIIVTTAKTSLYQRVESYAENRYDAYLRSRDCKPKISVVGGDFSFGPFRRVGGQLVIGDKFMALIDGTRGVTRYAKHPTYALVSRGYRGRIAQILDSIQPDTLIVSHDCTPRRRAEYIDTCANRCQPYVDMTDDKLSIIVR